MGKIDTIYLFLFKNNMNATMGICYLDQLGPWAHRLVTNHNCGRIWSGADLLFEFDSIEWIWNLLNHFEISFKKKFRENHQVIG